MQSYGAMGHEEPTTEQNAGLLERLSRPDNEIPHPVPIAVLLAKTDDLAVAVSGVAAYTSGISFELVVRFRALPAGIRRHELHELVSGWGDEPDPRRMLLGVEYADGRKASNIGGPAWREGGVSHDQPILTSGGGGGSDLAQDMSFWLSPIPPDGPLSFVFAWTALGVEETRHVVKDAALTSASARAVVLWPRQADDDHEPPPEPSLPAHGWFAALRQEPSS
jgi:hypothetical protein